MKKYLSLLLAMAMVLTTLVVPMSASAEGEDISVVVSADKETAKPGDEVTITVSAVSNGEAAVAVQAASVYVSYDNTAFNFVSETSDNGDVANAVVAGKTAKTLNYSYAAATEDDSISVATDEGTVLYTAKFTVTEAAGAAIGVKDFVVLNEAAYELQFASYGAADSAVVVYDSAIVNDSVTIEANTYELKIDGEDYTTTTSHVFEGVDSVTLNVTPDAHAEVAVSTSAGSVNAEDDGSYILSGSEEGTVYTVIVTPYGGTATTYTFTVSSKVSQVTIGLDNEKIDGVAVQKYEAGQPVNIDVPIDIAEGDEVAMVAFNVTYDADILTPVPSANVTVENGVVSYLYGEANAETGIASGAKLPSITFTAKEKYGSTAVSIDADTLQVVMVNNTIISDELADTIINPVDAKVVVVPADDAKWATVTPAQNDWVNIEYDIAVTNPVEGATVVYYESTDGSLIDAAAIYALAKNNVVENNKVTVTETTAKYVYIVAAIGSDPVAYQLVATVETFFDNVDPTITTGLNMTTWAKAPYDLVTTGLAASEEVEWSYKIGDATDYTEMTDVIVLAETYDNTVITVKAVDKAGNDATQEGILMVDGTAPVVTLTKGAQVNKEVALTVNATENESGEKATNVYYSATPLVEPTVDTIKALEEVIAVESVYTATKTGTYYAVVEDMVGNVGFGSVDVTITDTVSLPNVTFKTVIDGTSGAFKNADVLDFGDDINGTFTYVKMEVGSITDGTVAYTVNGETSTKTEWTTDEPGTYEVVITSTSSADAAVTDDVTYKFVIVDDQAEMDSPDGNATYTMIDYAMLRNAILTWGDAVIPNLDATKGFATYLSGDLNGDFNVNLADYTAIITAIQNGKTTGYYSFDILNNLKVAE